MGHKASKPVDAFMTHSMCYVRYVFCPGDFNNADKTSCTVTSRSVRSLSSVFLTVNATGNGPIRHSQSFRDCANAGRIIEVDGQEVNASLIDS